MKKKEQKRLRKLAKQHNKLSEKILMYQQALGQAPEGYDPDEGPDPREWLSLKEGVRHSLVQAYHHDAGLDLEGPEQRNSLHAAVHALAENQVALGLECAAGQTLYRIEQEGMARHDIIHGIGMVFVEWFVRASRGEKVNSVDYEQQVAELTREKIEKMMLEAQLADNE